MMFGFTLGFFYAVAKSMFYVLCSTIRVSIDLRVSPLQDKTQLLNLIQCNCSSVPGQMLLKQGSRNKPVILNNIFPVGECIHISHIVHWSLSIPINFRFAAEMLVAQVGSPADIL